MKRGLAAKAKGGLGKFVAGAPPMVDKLAAEVEAVLRDYFDAGRQQVTDELERQRDGEPVTGGDVAGREGAAISAAEKKPKRPKKPPRGVTPDDLAEQAEVIARTLAQATQAAVVAQVLRTLSVPLADAVLAEMALRASDAAALQMVATVTDLMQAGRAAEARAVREDIQTAIYSAILDERACETCADRDGEETDDIDAAEGWTPNPGCDGGDRCRRATIYELKQEGA
jgi:hypothetical protein